MEKIFLMTLCSINNLGIKTLKRLLVEEERISDLQALFDFCAEHLSKESRIRIPDLEWFQRTHEKADRLLAACAEKGVGVLAYGDSDYPKQLESIERPPMALFWKGVLKPLEEASFVAVVGSRKASLGGCGKAGDIGRALAEKGLSVVSGLALGIDESAHRGVLTAQGRTAAVLPGGVERIYPPENSRLSEQILQSGGLLISEYPPWESPEKWRFLERDRIQSGLSRWVVVVEAAAGGGAMHTARFARKQGKRLLVLEAEDGGPLSEGNRLLAMEKDATVIKNAKEILNEIDKDKERKRG